MSVAGEKARLWNKNFIAAGCGNFLMFFAFYLILPVLPMYLAEQFGASKSTVGVILSSYTLTALLVRPFAGFMVDTFPRKPLLLICYMSFILFFGGYILATGLMLFAVLRAMHGAAFGLVTVSNSTVAIDTMPSARRGEGIGYFGVSSNLAMACGPTASLFMHDALNNYNYIFATSLITGLIGFCCITLIRLPKRKPEEDPQIKEPISLDRFFLIKGIPGAMALCLLSFSYGILSTYVAVYGKEEVGITTGAGLFFILMASGLILSRLTSGRLLNKGYLTQLITAGIGFLFTGFLLFIALKTPFGYYGSAILIGLAYGFICPAFQTLFINMAPHNQRGTANSTYLTAWDLGLGTGVLLGGNIADISSYTAAYLTGLVLIVLGFIVFRLFTVSHFERNRLR